MVNIVPDNVKKAAEPFLTAWKMGHMYKLIDATLHEIHTSIKQESVTKEFYEATKQKVEALKYIANTTKDDALRLKTMNNASEIESYLKKMEFIISSKA